MRQITWTHPVEQCVPDWFDNEVVFQTQFLQVLIEVICIQMTQLPFKITVEHGSPNIVQIHLCSYTIYWHQIDIWILNLCGSRALASHFKCLTIKGHKQCSQCMSMISSRLGKMVASSVEVSSSSLSKGLEKTVWRTLSIRTWACSVANNSERGEGVERVLSASYHTLICCWASMSVSLCGISYAYRWWPPASWSPSCWGWIGRQRGPAPSSWAGPAPTPRGVAQSPPAVERG